MIVSFSIENWMSFRDKVDFSMLASSERQHGDRVSKLGKYNARILPIAAIYGGNASGKTNFFKALNFAKRFIVEGTRPNSLIGIEPFLLDDSSTERASSFVLELLSDEKIYEFSFTINYKVVLEEKLLEITRSSEKLLYHRYGEKIKFAASLEKDKPLNYVFKGTRDNQLFLTNSVSQKVEHFLPVYTWFKDYLVLIAPDSRFRPIEQFFDKTHPLYSSMNDMLAKLDTGVMHLGEDIIPFENLPLIESLKTELLENVKAGTTVRIDNGPNADRFLVSREKEKLIAKKLVTYHSKPDGNESKFEISQESDGTQRIIDLLPAFLDLSAEKSKKIYIIDEFDRSLHTLLLRKLIEVYLSTCSEDSRKQLLFTTHDVLLMDQSLLRRDEMWVAERDYTGASNLISFSEYKDIRYDKDIRKSYLQGRLGGIPQILMGEVL